jgi:hypothetical protein
MSGLELSRMSKIPPQPCTVDHGAGGGQVGYTCHMAAMHWAQMVLGSDQQRANRAVGDFAKSFCPGCKGNGPHGSVSPYEYGRHFCVTAQPVASRAALYNMAEVGDVLVTEHPSRPMHTMIVRQKRGNDHLTVRGFNNFGTLGTGVRDRYDPLSHNIAQDKYWVDPDRGLFGLGGVPLFLVKNVSFMTASRGLRRLA